MSVDLQHQYIVFLQQFLKGGFYTVKIEHLQPQIPPAAAKGGFYTRRRENFCFTLPPPVSMHTILIQASTFSTVCVKRGFYIGKIGEFQRNVPFTQAGCWVVP